MKPKILTAHAEKIVTPRSYQGLVKQQRGNIQSVEIVPPRFGRLGDFGRLSVRFKTPVLY